MAIFPEQMEKIDPADTAKSIERIDRYIRYMVERIEFNNTNDIKRLGAADATTQDVVKMFLTTTDTINLLRGEVQQLSNQTIALARQATEVNTNLTKLTERVAKLEKGTEG